MADDLPLGAWAADKPAIVNAKVEDQGDVGDLPDIVRFKVRVARLIMKRETNPAAESDQPAAFVFVSAGQFETFKAGRNIERLIHTGARRLTGRIHFVQATPTSSVVEEVNGDDAAMFLRLTTLGVDTLPTLIYVPQKPNSSLSFYPNGCNTDEGLQDISLELAPASIEDIEAVIDTVHRTELVTPDGMYPYKIWEVADQGRPARYAEQGVQQLLRIGLACRFTYCSVRREQVTKVGRTDLEIIDDRSGPPGSATHLALLELKVLRSRGETGIVVSDPDTKTHIEEGVDQAYSYGTEKNTRAKMLCCFDMRDDDHGDLATFAHVQSKASTLTVLLRRWFLYRDSPAYRAAIATAASS